jgi:diaminobutyrate-2-oxoglutarate transaminase
MLERQSGASRQENEVFGRLESNVQSYARNFPRIFSRARGTELWDVHGGRYLDFLAGAGSLNFGHNNPVFKEALIDYIEQDAITHSLDLHTEAKESFLEAMHDILLAPRGLDDYVMQFTGPTGTNAVEAALKIARKVTGRPNVIYFTNGFHGVSMGALSVTGNEYLRRAAGVPLQGAMPMPFDGYFGPDVDTIAYLERMLADPSSGVDTPAAIILETVQGEGGLNVARNEWLQRLQALCHKRKIVLIVDDIQAGCGRTGTFFSFEPSGIKPDIVTVSKSLSGYGLPLSIVLIKRALDEWKPGEHNGTFRGNNHAFVTATAMLETYWRTDAFAKEVQAKGEHLGRRLQAMVDRFSPDLVDARGRGMMRGVRCADPKRAGAVTAKAFEYGLIIERAGPEDEVIKCMMPLTTPYDELDEGLDILERALHEEFSKGVAAPKAVTARAASGELPSELHPAAMTTATVEASLTAR